MRYASMTRRLEGLGADKWAVHFAALAKKEAGENVVMLSIGEPDFPLRRRSPRPPNRRSMPAGSSTRPVAAK
jgi:hypothetical protein